MKKLFTLTLVGFSKTSYTENSLIGFSESSSSLEESLYSNDGGILEDFNSDYAVIEEVAVENISCYLSAKQIQWFKIEHESYEQFLIVKCDCPDFAKNIVNWWC